MQQQLPTLGRPTRNGLARPVVLAALVAGGVGGGWALLRGRAHATTEPVATVAPAPGDPAAAGAPVAAAAAGTAPTTAPVAGAAGTATAPPAPEPQKGGIRHVSVNVDGPLETSIVKVVGKDLGRPLSQVVVRSLVWWVAVPGDLRKGDALDLLVEERPSEEPLLHAVRFVSGKKGQTFRAYRFQPAGGKFARYYQPGGEELELRLKDGPIEEYEQVTSLLRDGRGHKGVDFKTPVGTPVLSPFDGSIGRKNWNWKGNGNSIEIVEAGGAHRAALLLHLSELPATVKTGEHVKRGEALAKSGNSGHSFAPHLHYQLMSASQQVLDPFAQHETFRESLPAAQKSAFETETHRLDGLLDLPPR